MSIDLSKPVPTLTISDQRIFEVNISVDPNQQKVTVIIPQTNVPTLEQLDQIATAVIKLHQQLYPTLELILSFPYLKLELGQLLGQSLNQTKTHPLLSRGFIPYIKTNSREKLDLLTKAYDNLLADATTDDDLKILGYLLFNNWIYYPTANLIKMAQQSPSSAALLLTSRTPLVMSSNRAYTDMSQFRDKNITAIKLTQAERNRIKNNRQILTTKDGNYKLIPVTRYAEGMSKGAYYEKTDLAYCGTFYYLDFDSEVLLKAEAATVIYFKNKLEAARYVLSYDYEFADQQMLPGIYRMVLNSYLEVIEENKLYYENTPNLASEVEASLTSDYWSPNLLFTEEYISSLTGQYITEFYALEDYLDQAICNGLAKLSYQVVILGMMAGSSRMVAEVLDTRPREESFANLVYITI